MLQKEPFSVVKERIQKKLDVNDKEFEKVSSVQECYLTNSQIFTTYSLNLQLSLVHVFST